MCLQKKIRVEMELEMFGIYVQQAVLLSHATTEAKNPAQFPLWKLFF